MRIINNASQVAEQIRALNLGEVIEDDGSVSINCSPENINSVARSLWGANISSRVGDGIQEGSVWIHDGQEAHEWNGGSSL